MKKEYKKILDKFEDLNKSHPTYTLGRHLSIALTDYGDVWGIPDKEFLFALEKYEAELEIESNDKIASPKYMEQLYKDVENFDNILNEDDE